MHVKTIVPVMLTTVSLLATAEQAPQREDVPVDLHVRAEWLELAPVTDGVGRVCTRSALRILRAVEPKTRAPYDSSTRVFACDPALLRRSFRIERTEFLLGEPILIEFAVALEGEGRWSEPFGGKYRARGRDDNFLFLMRHSDGTWVRDPYAPILVYRGGAAGPLTVERHKPHSHWHPVQRWCAVDRAGEYDLYCFQEAHGHEVVGSREALSAGLPEGVSKGHRLDDHGVLIDSRTGKCSERYSLAATWRREKWEPSPLVAEIPADVAKQASRSWSVSNATDFAHFRIVIKEGSPAQREEMVKQWTGFLDGSYVREQPPGRRTAARQAVCFSQRDDFLLLIEKWAGTDSRMSVFCGLAMRPSREATALLLKEPNARAIAAMYYLHPDRVPDAIPQLVEWLTHRDSRVRAQAEMRLHTWTGQGFHRNWDGYHYQHPTPEEARKMQPAWREWWAMNRLSFVPRKQ